MGQLQDPALVNMHNEYMKVPLPVIRKYTLIQFVILLCIFLITLTPAAMLFPVLIAVLVPLRLKYLPTIFSKEHMVLLDSNLQPSEDEDPSSELANMQRE